MKKTYTHSKGFQIQVEVRKGKPVIDKHGLINLIGGKYKGCNRVNEDTFFEKFEEVKG